MANFLFGFVIIASLLCQIEALKCNCENVKCKNEELKCRGPMVPNVCGCCFECAKLEGEKCGGPWNIYGTCAPGLKCLLNKCYNKKKVKCWRGCPKILKPVCASNQVEYGNLCLFEEANCKAGGVLELVDRKHCQVGAIGSLGDRLKKDGIAYDFDWHQQFVG